MGFCRKKSCVKCQNMPTIELDGPWSEKYVRGLIHNKITTCASVNAIGVTIS